MGGAEVFTWEIARRLVSQGHSVLLFASEFPGCKREESADGVTIMRAGSRYSVHRHAREFYKHTSGKARFDIVIDGINTKPFFTPSFVSHGERIIAIVFQLAREYWFYETPFPIGLMGYFLLERLWLRHYRNLPTITISKSTQNDLLRMGFKHIFEVHVGTNIPSHSSFATKTHYPVIVYDGRLRRAKRPDHVIKAFRLVKRTISDVELWVIGDGPMKKNLLENSEHGLKFFDSIEHVERVKLLERAWVLVNPSVREGFGINVINANAVGTPAIGYDVPGLRDSILHGSTGLLVKNGDISGLADALVTLISDEGLRTFLGKNALQYAKRFDWNNSAREFSNIIKHQEMPS